MNKKLDSVFHSVEECKESGHPCKMSKKNIDYIYKPDKGIKDTSIPKTLFSGKIQPKLADCVIIYNKDKLAIVEIKCGTVTKRLVNETFEKIENVDLGTIKYQEIDFNSNIYADNLFDESIQNNLKITTDLLFKANNLLNDISNNLEAIITKNSDYKSFKTKEKELLKDAFSLAKFIQKICISQTIDENIVLKFNNIISSIQEEI